MEQLDPREAADATVIRGAGATEKAEAVGRFRMECVGPDGVVKWVEEFDNIVTYEGKCYMLDCSLSNTSAYGACYLGLISSNGYTTGPALADTLAAHGGWNEAGNGLNYPNWSTPVGNGRAAVSWSAAFQNNKSISPAASFTIATNGGTVKGCLLAGGSGALPGNNNANGKLISAGTFLGGDKIVAVNDVLNVTYIMGL